MFLVINEYTIRAKLSLFVFHFSFFICKVKLQIFNIRTFPIFRLHFTHPILSMIQHTIIPSPIGPIYIEGSDKGVSRISFRPEDTHGDQGEIPACLQDCADQLSAYFAGTLKEFDLKLDFGDAPEFHIEVWKMVKLIPYGRTRTYTDIADIIDHHNAVRAVGHANSLNPLPIVVPCHRVIGKDGSLTGYVYGLEMKRWLLSHESPGQYMKQSDLMSVLEKV